MSDDGEPTYRMVVPFVSVASAGGPHDDDSYVAGFEVGQIDTRLEHEQPASLNVTVHTENLAQLDLVAMRRGYTLAQEPEAVHVDGWTSVTFTLADTQMTRWDRCWRTEPDDDGQSALVVEDEACWWVLCPASATLVLNAADVVVNGDGWGECSIGDSCDFPHLHIAANKVIRRLHEERP